MKRDDTDLGGRNRVFPETSLGMILPLIRETQSGDPQNSLEELSRRYWKPVYRYVRIAWAKTNEDAKDLTQAFFLWLLEGGSLQKYETERGSFRNYLKLLLRRYLMDEDKARGRLKRGGGRRIFPLDEEDLSLESVLEDPKGTDPEKAFDRTWAMDVTHRAIEAVRQRFDKAGRSPLFQVFEEYALKSGGKPPKYEELANAMGKKVTEIRDQLFVVREAVRTEIRCVLAESTTTTEELEEEWNALFGSG